METCGLETRPVEAVAIAHAGPPRSQRWLRIVHGVNVDDRKGMPSGDIALCRLCSQACTMLAGLGKLGLNNRLTRWAGNRLWIALGQCGYLW